MGCSDGWALLWKFPVSSHWGYIELTYHCLHHVPPGNTNWCGLFSNVSPIPTCKPLCHHLSICSLHHITTIHVYLIQRKSIYHWKKSRITEMLQGSNVTKLFVDQSYLWRRCIKFWKQHNIRNNHFVDSVWI